MNDWMGWLNMPVDKKSYITALRQMMGLIRRRPVNFGLEVGLGWGVSALTFLDMFPKADLMSVDKDVHLAAISKLQGLYLERFRFVSAKTITEIESYYAGCEPNRFVQWLYIDAGHEYEEVKRDIELYEKFLEVGGLIVFDDYGTQPTDRWHYPGVKQAVDGFMDANAGRFSALITPEGNSPTKPVCAVKTARA